MPVTCSKTHGANSVCFHCWNKCACLSKDRNCSTFWPERHLNQKLSWARGIAGDACRAMTQIPCSLTAASDKTEEVLGLRKRERDTTPIPHACLVEPNEGSVSSAIELLQS